MSTPDKESLRIKATPYFKLKKEKDRNYVGITFKREFGFIPEQIIVERLTSRNNYIRIIAVLTDEEIKKEDAMLAKQIKKDKKA